MSGDRPTALVDQDVKPRAVLEQGVEGLLDLEVGVEPTEEALIAALEGKEILYTTSRLPVNREVLEAVESLRLVAKIGTGLDTIDLTAAAEQDVTVVYTPGMNARSVAEHALTLLLCVKRNVLVGQRALEAGKWRDEVPNATPVAGTSVGIVGFGNVGSRLAGLLDGFNVDVYAYDPYVHDIDTQITGAELTDLETTLSEPEAVVVTAEHTAETRGMIDADAFATMRDDAVLVNTARGPIVDTDSLVDALREGRLAGAGLDVFETEPLPPDSPLHGFENVVTTPHIAASSIRARAAIIHTLVDCTARFLDGEVPPDRFLAPTPPTDR
ncbi:NAD(P)-dependent oxidoreductase [Halorubrum vacuolatum]|uniref:D-3-phosphoglycerate dehydrogenase n=1 Tax=Halorubrum vacuolatum TaxID=63740 RepID=A0A238WI52_HALVU|nr:NAD(P)-dependent oxidoreductase [Halorubrum vacuolatum]SNR46230.1 D-3-phosphoglycerate dehydrogenase [Halorubrum vacuolatum]